MNEQSRSFVRKLALYGGALLLVTTLAVPLFYSIYTLIDLSIDILHLDAGPERVHHTLYYGFIFTGILMIALIYLMMRRLKLRKIYAILIGFIFTGIATALNILVSTFAG
ncbi:MAG: hypothetical protein V4691_03950 [Pseudomonadota bacterium]